MKGPLKSLIFALVFCFACVPSIMHAQRTADSDIVVQHCRVWGLIKFFHPKVIRHKVDWDQQLIDDWDRISALGGKEAYNTYLTGLFNRLELPKTEITEEQLDAIRDNRLHELKAFEFLSESTKYRTLMDLSWIVKSPRLTEDNKSRMLSLIFRYAPLRHKTFRLSQGGKCINHHDALFTDTSRLTSAHYVLGLFRYWNTIEYFFPYKYLMDDPWDVALNETVDHFTKAKNFNAYINALERLSAYIDDSHGVVYPRRGAAGGETNKFLPYYLGYTNDTLFIVHVLDSLFAAQSGFHKGQIVTNINGTSADQYYHEFLQVSSNSTVQAARADGTSED